jgi:gluconolactonase
LSNVVWKERYVRDEPPQLNAELELVCGGAEFPEGPVFDGSGAVLFSNCGADYITRVTLDGEVERRWRAASSDPEVFTFRRTNGLAVHCDGSLFACDFQRNAIVRMLPDGSSECFADRCDGVPFKGPNDLACDPCCNLYFTDPAGSSRERPIGAVYRVECGTRQVRRVADGLAFPNGLAFTADARWLYVCESAENRVLRFSVTATGALANPEVFADLSTIGPGEPDGMALDALGRLWIAHFGAHAVRVVAPDGSYVGSVEMPAPENDMGPTNVAFAGPGLRFLYITDPGCSALLRMEPGVAGLPLFCAS